MALGIALQPDVKNMSWGAMPVSVVTLTGDASYPAGGYAMLPAQIAMRGILGAETIGENTAVIPYSIDWNNQTGKWQIFQTGLAFSGIFSELAPGTNCTSFSWTALVFGIR